jgi:hypothetical protein
MPSANSDGFLYPCNHPTEHPYFTQVLSRRLRQQRATSLLDGLSMMFSDVAFSIKARRMHEDFVRQFGHTWNSAVLADGTKQPFSTGAEAPDVKLDQIA